MPYPVASGRRQNAGIFLIAPAAKSGGAYRRTIAGTQDPVAIDPAVYSADISYASWTASLFAL